MAKPFCIIAKFLGSGENQFHLLMGKKN